MAFHVYPDPQTNPRNVAAGATSALESIVELVGVDNGPFGLDTMLIRVVMHGAGCGASGAADPTVILKADTGDEYDVPVSPTTVPIFNQPNDTGSQVANATVIAEANDVYRVEVYVFDPGSSWQIRIRNNDMVNAHTYVWVVSDATAEASQPWIDIPDDQSWDTILGKTLTGQSVPLVIQVNNKGTGSLTISDVPGPIPASDFEITSVPGAIGPNQCGNLSITFNAPATPGLSSVSYTVSSNDTTAVSGNPLAAHNTRVALSATRGQLEAMLLLDTSGSMGYTPDGTLPVSPTDARWSHAKLAAQSFLDLLGDFGGGLGRFAVGMFPDITGASQAYPPAPAVSSADFFAPADITPGDTATAGGNLNNHTPVPNGGATPMGHGTGRSIGTTVGSFGYFQGPGAGVDFNQRWLILMSDGKHNSGPPAPEDFYKTTEGDATCADPGNAGAGLSLVDKKVKVIAVGYGDPADTAFEIDHATLQRLACKTGGQFLDAGADDVGSGLLKAFRTAITAGLALDPTVDPSGVLTPSAPEARHKVDVLTYDNKVSFITTWATFDPERVFVQIMTPNCELITPDWAQSDPNISFHHSERYTIYTFNRQFLANEWDPANPRFGTWTLIISAPGMFGTFDGPVTPERYEYEVLTESRLRLRLNLDQSAYYAGDNIDLAANLTLDGVPLRNAAVTLHLTRPGQSADNWLAFSPVTEAEFRRSAKILAREDVTSLGIKTHALARKELFFPGADQSSTINMPESDRPGVYTARVTNVTVPGTYDFYVTAVGQTEEGVAFRREQRVQTYVGVRPKPDFSLVDIAYIQVEGAFQADVRVWPRDQFGNVYLVDPRFDSAIDITAQGGDLIGTMVDHHDGSYSRRLAFGAQRRPVVGLKVAGEEIIPRQPVAPVGRLHYAERVLGFELGGEAREGANQHREPEAALGDVTAKDRGVFVSLGSRGSIVLAPHGDEEQQAILAHGADDVTVFVQSDETLRPYLVEAQRVGSRGTWVEIGRSAGVTESFSLAKGKLKAARAIRISDLSAVTRDRQMQPSATPGVSIVGAGFGKLGEPPKSCIEQIFDLFKLCDPCTGEER